MVDTPNQNQNPNAGQVSNPAEGTSQQPRNPAQQNSQMLNPDAENAKGPAAAPGVVPSSPENRPKSELVGDPAVAQAGNEPEPKASVRKGESQWYTILSGKHQYKDPDTGESKIAVAGTEADQVYLSRQQYDLLSGRARLGPGRK